MFLINIITDIDSNGFQFMETFQWINMCFKFTLNRLAPYWNVFIAAEHHVFSFAQFSRKYFPIRFNLACYIAKLHFRP